METNAELLAQLIENTLVNHANDPRAALFELGAIMLDGSHSQQIVRALRGQNGLLPSEAATAWR